MPDEQIAAELEYDFCVAANMMLGDSHQEACKKAKTWIKEAREIDKEV